ncbi:hypothetical protein QBC46DRAFT_144517 [Diplogelasinospora grovesii]|uniref:Uncharacterized protein n=1 Tax=Diplogelasinospora grovesii TaxID=303347 RepID=A0AAN6N7G7_9PEZI|nr:hypothetical protein QBC46DRAFT_144517 [Diplogelasinospora grovesii]
MMIPYSSPHRQLHVPWLNQLRTTTERTLHVGCLRTLPTHFYAALGFYMAYTRTNTRAVEMLGMSEQEIRGITSSLNDAALLAHRMNPQTDRLAKQHEVGPACALVFGMYVVLVWMGGFVQVQVCGRYFVLSIVSPYLHSLATPVDDLRLSLNISAMLGSCIVSYIGVIGRRCKALYYTT